MHPDTSEDPEDRGASHEVEWLAWSEASLRLRSFARGRRLEWNDAEDFAQAVLLRMKLILARERSGGGDFPIHARRMWTVAWNVLHELQRRSWSRRHRELSLSDVEESTEFAREGPSSQLDGLAAVLRARWPGLVLTPQEVLYLEKFAEGHTTPEIAERLGWSRSAAWSVRQRILGKLKNLEGLGS